MNKLKRVLTGTLALAMAASMMTACGKKDDSSSASGDASNGGGDSSNASGGGSGEKTKLNVYTFTEETYTMLDIFEKDPANADIMDKYEFNIVLQDNASKYIELVQGDLAGDNGPDVFVADADYAQLFAANPNTAALKDLGIELNASDYYEYVLNFTKNDAGEYAGVSHQAAAGAVLYRTDYAEQVLGTKDPDEVQKHMDSWDHFKETADAMKENGIYMISGIDELKRCFMNNRDGAWIKGDMEYYCDEATVKEYLEVTKYLADNEETQYAQNTQWTPEWNTGMQDGVFCFFGCTWYLHYTIKPNCLTERSGAVDDEGNPTVADEDYKVGNGSYGLWGIIPGPAGYFWGGTWWFGSKAATENGKADGVKAVIEYFCVNDDSMKAYMEQTGDFPSKPSVADQLSAENDFLGGQDHYEIFKKAAAVVNTDTCTRYDDTFNTAVNEATTAYVINGDDIDTAIASIKEYAMSQIEGLK